MLFDFNNPLQVVPDDYATALNIQLPGFWDQYATQNTGDVPWYETAAKVASTLIMANYQREMLNAQLERAKQGLPPLDASKYGVGVNVGLSSDTQKLMMYGILAIGAVAVYAAMKR